MATGGVYIEGQAVVWQGTEELILSYSLIPQKFTCDITCCPGRKGGLHWSLAPSREFDSRPQHSIVCDCD